MSNSKQLSRRRFLSRAASTAAGSVLTGAAVLASKPESVLAAQDGHIGATRETPEAASVSVENEGYRMLFDAEKGRLVSLQSTYGVARDLLIPDHRELPVLKIEFLAGPNHFRTLSSLQAEKVTVKKSSTADEEVVTLEFRKMGGLSVSARATVRCPAKGALTYWNLEIDNGTDWWIANVQFPIIEIPYDDRSRGDFSHLLWSIVDGMLDGPVVPSMSLGAWGGHERDTPEIWRWNNYPGQWTSTQLMAYYNDAGGLYVACNDATGLPKLISPLHEESGVRMGLGHYPGTHGPGSTKLAYDVVIGTFQGDWHAAASIYRDWAQNQPFCSKKLAERQDVPKWIAEPVVGLAYPMRGQGDWDPPAAVNPEYTPATNALPYLEKLAAEFDCQLMPIVFNWEHAGPWVQPDAFPPLGGDEAFKEFMAKAKAKGWHPVIYGDGLCWVTSQKNTNYDGTAQFQAMNVASAVAHRPDGSLQEDVWAWRTNYVTCIGTDKGRQMVLEMTRKMAEYGPAVVQQFDQGPGPRACYASDHGHPPVPGPWMAKEFDELIRLDTEAAKSANPTVAMSCEGAPPETHLQNFQIWDARTRTCPLYSFLYHEYGNGHLGFYTNRVNDEALRLSVARAIAQGYMVTLTLRDKGRIEYDWDQLWTRAIPDQAAIIDWTKRLTQFRAGVARDYLVFGRMLRPWEVSNVNMRNFGWGDEPLVQSTTWQAQDGRIGIVLANYADLGESPRIQLEGQGTKQVDLYLDGQRSSKTMQLPVTLALEMEPRSICLIEVHKA